MQIATSQTREKYPLSPKKIVKKTIAGVIGWTIFLSIIFITFGGIGIGIAVDANQNAASVLVSLLLTAVGFIILLSLIALLSYLYQRWYFVVYFYDILDDYIVIRKGPIAPTEITIPWERIQDVYVDQDIFDRMFGLYDVHLSTATITSGIQAHIDGVEKEAGDGLREALLEKIRSRISKK